MNNFPRMVYKHGGPEEIHGGRFSTLIVTDADELDAALAAGWALTTPEAKEAAEKLAGGGAADNAPPTRDELKRKADELGLTYAGNISTEKLSALVEAALAEKKD